MGRKQEVIEMLEGEHFIEINQCIHWVKIKGDYINEIPILVIHGGPGGNHYTFERTSGLLLEESMPVIYFEHRHCGRSEKVKDMKSININQLIDDIESLRVELGINQFNLLGYSFGGELAMNYAVKHPKHINKIILEAPSLITLPMSNLTQLNGFLTVFNDDNRKLLIEYIKTHHIQESIAYAWSIASVDETDRLLFHSKENAVLNRRLWQESKLSNDGTFYKEIIQLMESELLLEQLSNFNKPTLIITGIFDRNTGIATTQLIQSKLENCKVEYFINSAHFPDIEETTLFVETINNFLGGSK
ncbi:alpha/beta fold hydrolase [Macrococcus animalis]|uniref:alpha/beta fold hydrolase n=1 Tax=Macrococcus animalis TaxID=3395467 RepID=UPI0039BE4CF9